MKSHTSLVAQQTCLSEWADLIRDCQNRPQGMKIDKWCQLHDITKASYYWRLRKVREAYLETAEQTHAFVEVPSSAIQPANITSEHKIAAVIRGRSNLTLEITEQASASFLKTLLGVLSNAQRWLRVQKSISGDWIHGSAQMARWFGQDHAK